MLATSPFCRRVALALAVGAFMASSGYGGEGEMLHLRCSNPTNGATWPIVVDTEHQLVDSMPAKISDTSITWYNSKGGIFRLDRASGKLQLSAPSSTGGYFLYYVCSPA
jgi:hypothetical protein